MPRNKLYGDFLISTKDNLVPVFIYSNTIRGREKYILDLKNLIYENAILPTELFRISLSLAKLDAVLRSDVEKDSTISVVLLSGITWKGVVDDIKLIIQDKVSQKIQQSTSTTIPTTTLAPAMKLTRDWKPYYVMPKTGIQIFQDENAPNKNLFLFYIPELPYGRDIIDESEINTFVKQIELLSFLGSASYYYSEKLGFLPSQDSYTIEFDFLDFASSSLPSLDVQELLFKQIDQKLIDSLKLTDFSLTQAPKNTYTIEDIKDLKKGDKVAVKFGQDFYIQITIQGDDNQAGVDGKVGDLIDILDGGTSNDIFYPINWFLDPEYELKIIKKDDAGSVVDDILVAPSTTLDEEDLEIAKKQLGQLLLMQTFLSPIDFERKIQINQNIDDAQKKINELNFKILESRLSGDNIFEDLFEQSFTPINSMYSDVYATSTSTQSGQEPASSDFFTPDGQPSKLSNSLNELIRTPQFKEWFGDWQLAYAYKDSNAYEISCSKVVTKDYEPLVVWHGTGQQFSYFRFDKFPAAYFAVNWRYSKWFADLQGGGNGYTIPFFLNVRNPLDLSRFHTRLIRPKEFFDYMYLTTGMNMEELEVNPLFMDSSAPPMETWVYIRNNARMLKKLSDNHVFDGIRFYETNPSVPEGESAHVTEAYIVFNPNQCKVADPERGILLFASLKSFLLKQGGKI